MSSREPSTIPGKTESILLQKGLSLYKQPLKDKRGSPNWYARVFLPFDGRRIHTKSTGTTDEKAARRFAQEFYGECLLQKSIRDGTLPVAQEAVRKSKLRFDRIVDQWLNRLKTEAGDDLRRLRHWKDCQGAALGKTGFATYFGKADINSITPEMIDQYVIFKKSNSTKGNLAGTTIKRTLVLLNVVFKFAYKSRLLEHLPFMPKVKQQDNPRAWFSHDEYRRLHNAARNKAVAFKRKGDLKLAEEWQELSDFIIFMVSSFIRPGEWPHLQHKHVKVERGENAHLKLAITRVRRQRPWHRLGVEI